MITVSLTDSMIIPSAPNKNESEGWDCRNFPHIMTAVSILRGQIASGTVSCQSIRSSRCGEITPDLINCESYGCKVYSKALLPTDLKFTTSHYIGQAIVDVDGCPEHRVQFLIRPRMGNQLRDYLLGMVSNVYIPERFSSTGCGGGENDNQWLLLLVWRCAFEQAIKKAAVPKTYVFRSENLKRFRGRLNVARHIQHNLTDQSNMFCDFRPLTMDTTINRTIRYVYRLVANSDLKGALRTFSDLAEHDERLASFGVGSGPVSPEKIDRIVYTRMTEPYRQVMELSKIVIRGFGARDLGHGSPAPAFFVDMAELWECYLMRVFRERLPEYAFVSPNDGRERYWMFDRKRSVRPDFFAKDETGRIIAVIDAKYKRYACIGRTAVDRHAVSRDDLYQISTYLYRFADPAKPTVGLFVSPYEKAGNDVENVIDGNHRIGVCNLSLPLIVDDDSDDDRREKLSASRRDIVNRLREEEEDFADRFRRIIRKSVG